MRTIKNARIILLSILILFASTGSINPQQSAFHIKGVVLKTNSNIPIPGLTVTLLNPVIGRSVPSMSNQFGQFFFYNIPFRGEPYYIEVYWGNELVYRSILNVQLALRQPVVIYL